MFAAITLKYKRRSFHIESCQKVADVMANSEEIDQTAPLGVVRSGLALFAKACLSENIESLEYFDATIYFMHPRKYCNHPNI